MTDLKKTILLVSADRTATGSLEKLLELNGYRASRDVSVQLYQLDRVGPVIEVAL